VTGTVGDRQLDFTALGSAETFRGDVTPGHADIDVRVYK
jgi:hypothetical protein